MGETNEQTAALLPVSGPTEDAESALALEFREVLRDLAGDLANTVASPSVSGIAETVRAELGSLASELRSNFEREVSSLRAEQASLLDAVREQIFALRTSSEASMVATLTQGFGEHQAKLAQTIDTRLLPIVDRIDGLKRLEGKLTDCATTTGDVVVGAVESIKGQVQGFADAGESLTGALAGTANQLGTQAKELRDTVTTIVPSLSNAARGLEASQEGLKSMLRTYNDTLDRSLTALEGKFAGLLASNLERINQRQVELENRIRDTAGRTEEAVVDLMRGNEAHHQSMVDSTATTLGQLEMFAKSFHTTTSSLKGLFYLCSAAVVGLVFVSYLLLVGR